MLFGAAAVSQLHAQTAYQFSGTAYSQNFDNLPYNSSGADVVPNSTGTINSYNYTLPAAGTAYDLSSTLSASPISSLAGWFALGPAKNVYGANGGSTTTGGIYSYGGTSGSALTNRALGMESTSTSGINEVGMLLYNNSSSTTYNQLNISYLAELWHQGSAAKTLNFGYTITSADEALPTTGLTAVAALISPSFGTGTVQATDASAPSTSMTVTDSTLNLSTGWSAGQYLWLTWTNSSNAGSGQGIAIDNFNFSASNTAAPANVTWAVTNGVWNTTTGNWTGGTPTANLYKDGDYALFSNTSGGTVTISTTLAPGSTTDSASSGTYSFTGAGTINGSGSLTKSGGGTLDLTGMTAGNGYSGGTNLNGGTLIVSSDNQLGASAGPLTFAGGALQTNTAGITSARNITVSTGGGTFTTNGLNSSTSGSSSISDVFMTSGAGNLALNGAVTFGSSTGSLTIGSGGSITFGQSAGGTVTMSAGGTFIGNLVVANALRVNFDAGTFNGSGMIQAQSTGTTLTNSSTAAGPGVVSNAIALNSTGIAFMKGNVAVGPYTAGNFVTSLGGTTSTNSTSPVTFSGVISGNSDLNIAGGGSAGTTGGGGGPVVLGLAGTPGGAGGYETYTGTTTINNNGVITLAASNVLPTGTDVIVGTETGLGTATLNLNGFSQQIGSISDGANVTGTAHTVTITNNGTSSPATLTIGDSTTPATLSTEPITDGTSTLALVKTGTDTITLAGTHSAFSGGVTVNQGTLTATGGGALGTGFVMVNPTGTSGTPADAATLNTKAGSIASGTALTVNTNSATAIGTVNFTTSSPNIGSLNGNGSVVLQNSTGTALTIGYTNNLSSSFSGVISEATAGEGSVIMASTNTLTLSGANTYSGATTVNTGTLLLSATGSINNSTSVQVNNNGALTLGNPTALSDAGTLSLNAGTTLNLDAANNTSEVIAALDLDGTMEPDGVYSASRLTGLDSSINFYSQNGETLTVTGVPEPSTILGGILMVGALGWSQRRRLT